MTTEVPPGLQELRMPSLAESVVEGEILAWLIEEGQPVVEGQPVLEVMTDKVTVELPSPLSGVLRRQLAQVGAVVPVGAALGLVETASASAATASVRPSGAVPGPPRQTPETQTPQASAPAAAQDGPREERSIIESAGVQAEDPSQAASVFVGWQRAASGETAVQATAAESASAALSSAARILAAPSARRLARERGVDLGAVTGSGTNGSVRQADVLAHLDRRPGAGAAQFQVTTPPQPATSLQPVLPPTWPPPAPPAYRTPAGYEQLEDRTPFQGTRRAISQALQASLLYTAQTHTIEELDCTALTALRDELRPDAAGAGVKLGYLPFFFKAVSVALHDFPALNSSLDEQRSELVRKRFVHLGMAVSTDAGLMVPVLRDVDRRSVLDLARESAELAESARNGTLKAQQMQDATFTVSNIGAVGALVGFPILNPPAAGILSLHSVTKRPVAAVRDGEDVVVVRPMMYLTLGFDHRLVDGVDAARFGRRVVELLERPSLLLLRM